MSKVGTAPVTVAVPARTSGPLALQGGAPVASPAIGVVKVEITESDIDAALVVLKSGMLAQGKNVLALEEAFVKASGCKHAVACANGTCALQLAYEPLFDPGDEVLVPAWSYFATASMIVARGGIPVFCDADPITYGIDVADAASKVTPRTAAIAATHIYGNPVDIDGVEGLAAKHGLSVIYDAAQSHLATYKGRGIGAYGDAVTYSFYATKNLTTGEGGMVTTNDDELAAKLRLLRSHGEPQKYTHTMIGYNYRMTDLEAAIGVSQMKRLADLTQRRRANAAKLDRLIAQIPGLTPPTPTPGGEHVYHLYPVRLDEPRFRSVENGLGVRDSFCKALNAEGVGTAIHYPRSLTRQPVFDKPGVRHCAVADRLSRELFCIPVHQALTDAQIGQIGDALAKVADALRA
ncbi:MAG: DegT/DnrJ/EryC1/StrS family aminotransferase [Phycisphaerales bacterium]|nr:DegT/DnrJ/EryC1/StrS family aminotransferase [Phycisphaerales bacterium]